MNKEEPSDSVQCRECREVYLKAYNQLVSRTLSIIQNDLGKALHWKQRLESSESTPIMKECIGDSEKRIEEYELIITLLKKELGEEMKTSKGER